MLSESAVPCANLIDVRTQDKDRPGVAQLVKAFQSSEVKQLVESSFGGLLVVAFWIPRFAWNGCLLADEACRTPTCSTA